MAGDLEMNRLHEFAFDVSGFAAGLDDTEAEQVRDELLRDVRGVPARSRVRWVDDRAQCLLRSEAL